MKKFLIILICLSFNNAVLALDNSYVQTLNVSGMPHGKYEGIETCDELDVDRIKACACIPAGVADITSRVYFLLSIIGPLLVLITGGYDIAKALAGQDAKSIAKAQNRLVNKFIAAACIFLVFTFVKFGVGLVADDADNLFKCVNILLEGYEI
ncbi:MAG: hypothetical protein IJB71_00465 [Bacilli bacterium]|nr:hypothetical protein [Bacilli bacterium]